MRAMRIDCTLLSALVALALVLPACAWPQDPIVVGLDADMSSGSAKSGEAIRRGIVLAMEEINRGGGVLGRPLQLVVKDHHGNPARGLDNLDALAGLDNLVAVVGGLHTPVIMAELARIHERRIVFLVPWAAGTAIVANGYRPNYVFRVSARDQYAGEFLVAQAASRGHRRFGLLLEHTAWGRSNHQAMQAAIAARGLALVSTQWFHWGVSDLKAQTTAIQRAGADVVMLVANTPEGALAVKAQAALAEDRRLPIFSHWGITGGNFFETARAGLKQVMLYFLQTFSFFDPPFPDRAEAFYEHYARSFDGVQSPGDIFSPVGSAHAYDLLHLLARAIEKARTTDREAVRDAFERLGSYRGLVRDYAPPFTPERHDALDGEDLLLARFDAAGAIVPVTRVHP